MKKHACAWPLVNVLIAGYAIGRHDMSSGHVGMGMKSEQAMMTKMDTNGDGMLSKDEFMKGHEIMFDRMKGPDGRFR